MTQQPLPAELQSLVGSTPYDFVVKAKRRFKRKKAFSLLFFGLIWTAMTSSFMIPMLISFLSGEDVHMTVNDVDRIVNISDGIGAIGMGLGFPAIFIIAGFGMLVLAIYQLTAKGFWYVGTAESLIQHSHKETRHIDWENFSGDIRSNRKSVTLLMRTGRMEKRGKHGRQYVPNEIYIGGIENASDVAHISRERIKEHDPTPSTTQTNYS